YFMFDDGKAFPIIGEVTPHILEQAWYLQFPMPYVYTLWWPWVKNFHGEWAIGATDSYGFTKFIWIDKALKKSMGF
ncbi:MAG: ABC transporter substrate-binding protein, partial [Chloroflexi bacterium]|nr:ABC transporter substrate-binding protein [Chloroflexota bacterium]